MEMVNTEALRHHTVANKKCLLAISLARAGDVPWYSLHRPQFLLIEEQETECFARARTGRVAETEAIRALTNARKGITLCLRKIGTKPSSVAGSRTSGGRPAISIL